MNKWIGIFAAVALAGCATSSQVVSPNTGPSVQQAQAAPYDGPKQRIAVSGFETRSAKASREIGSGMTDMLVDALFNSNRFIVLERDRLDAVTTEQDLSNSDRFRKDTAAPLGQLEGAQLLVRGAITEFEPDCKGGSVILVSGKQACIGLNCGSWTWPPAAWSTPPRCRPPRRTTAWAWCSRSAACLSAWAPTATPRWKALSATPSNPP